MPTHYSWNILTSRNDTRKGLESSLLAMEGGTHSTCKMVAAPASAHLPQAEGYSDISQRFVTEARTQTGSQELKFIINVQ